MREAAARRGIAMNGSARQVRLEDLNGFDWVLVMDDDNLADVEDLARRHPNDHSAKIARFCDFCALNQTDEVPDPYYGGEDGFETVLDLLEDGCAEIVRRFQAGQL
jgi:protein-tyrosine phosphatase